MSLMGRNRKRLTATPPALILDDCCGGCKWFHTLSGGASLGWGVRGNPQSHRVGLLTFEQCFFGLHSTTTESDPA